MDIQPNTGIKRVLLVDEFTEDEDSMIQLILNLKDQFNVRNIFCDKQINFVNRLKRYVGNGLNYKEQIDRLKIILNPYKLERKIEVIFIPLHERMHKLLSSYSDSELAFLLDAMTEFIDQTREESKKLRSLQRQSSMK